LGLAEKDLRPVGLDLRHEPLLLVVGDQGAGKSSVLRLLAHEFVRTRSPAEGQLLVVDPRRSLAGEVPADVLLDASVADLATRLGARGPGWTGPEVLVLVDDHDLVAPTVHALVPLLPLARDLGVRVAVTRRAGGIGRAMFDPLLQGLRDLAAPTLLLSGSPDEGALLDGVRLAKAVPGRARLVTRDRGAEVVQVAWVDPRGGCGAYSASA
jgi:S-DNA-T family DNA segregation ATPase FtsK/SpoIIIE